MRDAEWCGWAPGPGWRKYAGYVLVEAEQDPEGTEARIAEGRSSCGRRFPAGKTDIYAAKAAERRKRK